MGSVPQGLLITGDVHHVNDVRKMLNSNPWLEGAK